jgi:hypothetical protein
MFWNKKKPKRDEPDNARFMIDRGTDCWVLFQKINRSWTHRGSFKDYETAVRHMHELNDYPRYFI